MGKRKPRANRARRQSRLYLLARAALAPTEKGHLGEAESWLAGYASGSGPDRVQGRKVLRNVRREAHHNGERPYGNPDALVAFLTIWASGSAAADTDNQRHEHFSESCSRSVGCGTLIPPGVLPLLLLRYVTSFTLAATLIERMLGEVARIEFHSGRLTPENAFAQLAESWDPSRLSETDRLGLAGDESVFATFTFDPNLRRDQARQVAEALALGVAARSGPQDEILIEFIYRTDRVSNCRIPTFADAGWYDLFEPAPERRPDRRRWKTLVGWTKPLRSQSPQPELVHDNQLLNVLHRPPRLVGRL